MAGLNPMSKSDKIRVLIVDDIADTHENLRKLLYFEKDIEVVASALDGHQAVDMAKSLEPDIILMDINMPDFDGIAATEEIRSLGLPSQVIMMSVQGETDYLRRSMLAGAREFLVKPFSGEELANSVRRVHQVRTEQVQRRASAALSTSSQDNGKVHGKVVTVFSPKGGVGRTTIVSNLAVAVRESAQKKVVLVDCSLQFGDVGVLLNVESQKTIIDLIPHIDGLELDFVEDILATHSSGIKVLPGPTRPEMAELVTAESLKTILSKLRESYDYVFVDTWPSFQDTMLSVLDLSDAIIVVLTLELPAIKNVKLFLDVADALGYPPEKLILVLNRADSTGGIRVADVEASLRRPIAASIVSDGRLVTYALNQGVPFVLSAKNSPVSRSLYDLARILVNGRMEKSETAVSHVKNTRRLPGILSFGRHG